MEKVGELCLWEERFSFGEDRPVFIFEASSLLYFVLNCTTRKPQYCR